MNARKLAAAPLALSIALLGACAAPHEPAEPAAPAVDVAAEAQAVRDRSAAWLTLAQANDAAGIASGIFAEDGVSLFDGDVWIGRSAIQAGIESDYAAGPGRTITWTTSSVEVAASGELAWERGTSISDPDGAGEAPEQRGEYVTVWKKVDGTWRAVADAGTNYPSGE
jgi:uncharacterized protein (TIGR02246 family)